MMKQNYAHVHVLRTKHFRLLNDREKSPMPESEAKQLCLHLQSLSHQLSLILANSKELADTRRRFFSQQTSL